MLNKDIKMPELYLTKENFDKNIDRTLNIANRDLQISKEFKELAFYNPMTLLREGKPNYLVGFPIPIPILLEYSAYQILPTTSLSIAEYTLKKIIGMEYPISSIKYDNASIIFDEIDQCAKFKGKIPDQFISYLLKTSIFSGDIKDMITLVDDVKRTVRKEVIDGSSSIIVFERYVEYMRLKEGW